MVDEPQVEPTPEPVVPTEPQPEPEPSTPPSEPRGEPSPHPLEPGGPRFEQVYAEKKQLEAQLAQTQAQLQTIAAQQQAAQQQAQGRREYTEDELELMEEAARERGDRQTVRSIQQYRVDRQVRAVLQEETRRSQQTQLGQVVGRDLLGTFKDLQDPTSELYRSAAAEYAQLAQEYAVKGLAIQQDVHGVELAVWRAVRRNPGLAKTLVEVPVAKKPSAAETHVEEGASRPSTPEPGRAKLTQRELDFCRRSGMDPKEFGKYKVDRRGRG